LEDAVEIGLKELLLAAEKRRPATTMAASARPGSQHLTSHHSYIAILAS